MAPTYLPLIRTQRFSPGATPSCRARRDARDHGPRDAGTQEGAVPPMNHSPGAAGKRASSPAAGGGVMAGLRFGVWLPTYAWADAGREQARRLAASVQKCEEHGFDIWVIDHLLTASGLYGVAWL